MVTLFRSVLFLALISTLGCPTPRGDDDSEPGDDDDAAGAGDWDSSSIDPDALVVYLGSPAALTVADFGDASIVVLGENAGPTYPDHNAFLDLVDALTAEGVEVYAWLEAGAPRAPPSFAPLSPR